MVTEDVEENGSVRNSIIFDQSKNEIFTSNHHFSEISKKLKKPWKFLVNKDKITTETLSVAKVFVIAGPRDKFSPSEVEELSKYLDSGGAILVMMGGDKESKSSIGINSLLEKYGTKVNNDCVVRTSYYRYFHPKEVLIPNGVLNRSLCAAAGKGPVHSFMDDSSYKQSLSFVFPYGSTLDVVKPSFAILSSGSVAFPLNRPVCSIYGGENDTKRGKLVVVGSAQMFTDQYIQKEDNWKVFTVLLNFLTDEGSVRLDLIDAQDPEIDEYFQVPDIESLANSIKSCLQESDEVPHDITNLFDHTLFAMDTAMVSKAIDAYSQLRVKHEPLSLIVPQFETPLPPLLPSVFPPNFRDLAPPSLELYDLDEHFSTPKARLAQITNKCTEDDLEYFIRECGDILDISSSLPENKRTAKNILEVLIYELAKFKNSFEDVAGGDW